MIMSMDGNNSLKQLSRPNHHTIKKLFPSNYYLTSEEVDLYKNEVKSHVTRKDITETPEAMAVSGDIAMCTDHGKLPMPMQTRELYGNWFPVEKLMYYAL